MESAVTLQPRAATGVLQQADLRPVVNRPARPCVAGKTQPMVYRAEMASLGAQVRTLLREEEGNSVWGAAQQHLFQQTDLARKTAGAMLLRLNSVYRKSIQDRLQAERRRRIRLRLFVLTAVVLVSVSLALVNMPSIATLEPVLLQTASLDQLSFP